MAGRGRGGGRGRGRGMSFDARDLGFGASEQLPGPVLQPPPTYPPLDYQPASMTLTAEMEYMVALKKDLVVFFKDNWSLSDKDEYKSDVRNITPQFDWRLFPSELKPNKKTVSKKRPTKSVDDEEAKKKYLNVLDAMANLEETREETEKEKNGDGEEKEDADEVENEDEEEIDDLDEEMDDGTDYVNNYFDNGEGFDDDDDNGNDGPIY